MRSVFTAFVGCGLLLPAAVLTAATGCSAQRAGGVPPTGPELSLTSGDHEIQIRHDGRDRRYFVHVPQGVVTAAPVVMALHGGGGTAAGFKDDYELDPVSDREGFIAVYPDGTGPVADRLLTWNGGPHCCGYARDRDVDDVGFLLAVLDDLRTRIPYDERRVYLTGHSNGAIMAYRVAAEAPSRVAAVVAVAGAMWVEGLSPSVATPILHIHSVDDPRALYEGGVGPPFPGTNQTVDHVAVTEGLDYWVRINRCGPSPVTVESGDGQGRDRGQRWVRLRWSGCSGGTVVEHIRMEGVGHGWPGTNAGPLIRRIIGPSTTMIRASEEVWRFASQFAR